MDDGDKKALHILERFPHGAAGSPQNVFRAFLYVSLRRYYADRYPSAGTESEVITVAIKTVREHIHYRDWLPHVEATTALAGEHSVDPLEGLERVGTVKLSHEGEKIEERLADARYTTEWFRLSYGGTWMLNVLDSSGECVDAALADDPQDAILAVEERLLA